MRRWFSADYHLGHKNIIEYCRRPFKSLEDMDDRIIKNHNARVKPEDIVFFIGDFCFRNSPGGKKGEGTIIKSKEWQQKLNGKFIFIKGNHDRNNSTKTIIESMIIRYGGKYVNLVHNPKYINMNCKINFVGHVHEKWEIRRIERGGKITDIINTGVDVWNFKPISFEEIMERYHSWLRNVKKKILQN